MNTWHIVEGILIVLGWKLILYLAKAARNMPREEVVQICIRTIELSMIPLIFWGDNHGWSFCARYTLLCICMFGQMIRFCMEKAPLTRWDVFWGIAIPLFGLIIGAIDGKIQIKIT